MDGNTITIQPGTVTTDGDSITSTGPVTFDGMTYESVSGFTFNESTNVVEITGAVDVETADGNFNQIGQSTFIPDGTGSGSGGLDQATVTSNSATPNTIQLPTADVTLPTTGDSVSVDYNVPVGNTDDSAVSGGRTGYTVTTEADNVKLVTDTEEAVISITGEVDPGRVITGTNGSETTLQAVGETLVEIDPVLGVVAVHLAPTSRYISYRNNSGVLPFAIYSNMTFSFYLKKDESQIIDLSNCMQCGVYDIAEKRVVLKGVVEYEAVVVNSTGQTEYVDLIESLTEDNVIAMHQGRVTYTEGTLARFFSSSFEVMVEEGVNFYNFHEFNAPFVINTINDNIDITAQRLTRTLPSNVFMN